MSDLVSLCGLWKNSSEKGDYLSGTLGGARVVVFKNTYKKEPKHPDYQMYVSKRKKRGDADGQSSEAPAPQQAPIPQEDVPF